MYYVTIWLKIFDNKNQFNIFLSDYKIIFKLKKQLQKNIKVTLKSFALVTYFHIYKITFKRQI